MKDRIENIDDILSTFGGEKWVELGESGKEIKIINLMAGHDAEIREFMDANKGRDVMVIAAKYVSLACPAFGGDASKAAMLPRDILTKLFNAVLEFNGIGINADEEAEKNSEGEAT